MNPFKIGGQVRLQPDERPMGWDWWPFDTVRLHPGETGLVTRISGDGYLYVHHERGEFQRRMLQTVESEN